MFIENIILMTKIKIWTDVASWYQRKVMKVPNIAVLKLLFNRAKSDFQIVPTVLSFLIADAVGVNIEWWHLVIIIGFFIIHILWSLDRGVRQEVDFHWKKSTEWQEMKKKIDEIYSREQSTHT